MDKLPVIDKYAARLLMISFFLPMKLQVVAVISVCLYFVWRTFSIGQQVPHSNYLWALVLGSCYLLYVFSISITPSEFRPVLFTLCGQVVSLLLLPAAFVIVTPAFGQLIKQELRWFAYACFASCLLGNAGFVYQYNFTAGAHTLSHVAYRLAFESCSGIHPTYMGMFLCFSVCILLQARGFDTKAGKIIKFLFIYCLLFFLLLLVAKSALIAMIIIGAHYTYLHRQHLHRYKALIAGLLASVIAACCFIPFVAQRFKEMLPYFGIGKPGSAVDNSVYIRRLVWETDMELLRANWVAGVGPGAVQHLLRERYFFYSLANHFNVGYYDPHNQYVSMWLSFGLLGILLFATVLVIQLVKAIRSKDHLYAYLLVILCITFCTETVLLRQYGLLFYAIFTSFFFFLNTHYKPGNSKQH